MTSDQRADAAFRTYAELVKQHKREPDRWDDPDRIAARDNAHTRFRELFEAA